MGDQSKLYKLEGEGLVLRLASQSLFKARNKSTAVSLIC